MSLRRLPFHRVLHRPALFLGGEREPALMTLIIAGGLAVSGMNFEAGALGERAACNKLRLAAISRRRQPRVAPSP